MNEQPELQNFCSCPWKVPITTKINCLNLKILKINGIIATFRQFSENKNMVLLWQKIVENKTWSCLSTVLFIVQAMRARFG